MKAIYLGLGVLSCAFAFANELPNELLDKKTLREYEKNAKHSKDYHEVLPSIKSSGEKTELEKEVSSLMAFTEASPPKMAIYGEEDLEERFSNFDKKIAKYLLDTKTINGS